MIWFDGEIIWFEGPVKLFSGKRAFVQLEKLICHNRKLLNFNAISNIFRKNFPFIFCGK